MLRPQSVDASNRAKVKTLPKKQAAVYQKKVIQPIVKCQVSTSKPSSILPQPLRPKTPTHAPKITMIGIRATGTTAATATVTVMALGIATGIGSAETAAETVEESETVMAGTS